MEIIGVAILFGLLMLRDERRERAVNFPDQTCRVCPEAIYFDWRHRIWRHADGLQWKPYPTIPMNHPAMPFRGEPEQ